MTPERKQRDPSTPDDIYETVLDKTEQGFCIVEVIFSDANEPVDYRFLEVNAAFEQQTGITDGVGRRMREIEPAHEDHWFQIYGEVAETGKSVRFEHEANALMGGWYEVNAFRIGGDNSRKVGIFFDDITKRKAAEQTLQEQNRKKEEFLAVLAHELRNPLAPIRNGVEILRNQSIGHPATDRAIAMIDRQVDQMARILDDLLDINRVSSGRIILDTERVDLASLVGRVAEDFRHQFENDGQEFTYHRPVEPHFVDGDSTRIRQLIGNLLDNACKYTPREGHISLSLERDGTSAVIRVRDDGVGIEPRKLDDLFDMWTQADAAIDRSTSGLGIGLSLVQDLVDLHDGSVKAHSEGPGEGSTFTVRLPLTTAPFSQTSDTDAAETSTQSHRILIVDDRADIADGLATVLEMSGHDVDVAYSGGEALQKMQEIQPDAIVLDIGLPDMDGYHVCRRIREQPGGEDVCIVAATGWGREKDRSRSREAGFDAHLVKPFEPAQLLETIEACQHD